MCVCDTQKFSVLRVVNKLFCFFLFGLLGIRSKKIPNQQTVGHADVYGEHEVLVFPVLNVVSLRFEMCFTNAGCKC